MLLGDAKRLFAVYCDIMCWKLLMQLLLSVCQMIHVS